MILRVSRSAERYHHGNLRDVLLDAARGLIEHTPVADLSLREVARIAGVSHNAPYHHFADRTELLKALSAAGMRELLEAQRIAAASTDDPRERLIAVGIAYADYAVAHPNAFALVFDPEYCIPGSPSDESGPLIAENEAMLAQLVAASDPSLDDAGVIALSAALWATVHGLAGLVSTRHLPPEVIEPALRALAPSR
jgi:AcrR family transcriptional regulator